MDDEHILALIPHNVVQQAASTLPPPETCVGKTLGVEVEVPGGRRATVLYKPLFQGPGKQSQWFWAPVSAELIE
jgi:hypothetical protein